MTATLQISTQTGNTVYAIAYDDPESSDEVWDEVNQTFTNYAKADWTDYAIPLLEIGTGSRLYRGTWDPGKGGRFTVLIFRQAGSNPDPDKDELLGADEVLYDGSREVHIARDYDGIPLYRIWRMILAWMASPRTEFVDNGNNTFTYSIYAQNGTTVEYEFTFNQDGEWISSNIP